MACNECAKARGLMAILLMHTLHAGSLKCEGRGRCRYDAPNKKPTYLRYSRSKAAAMRWIERFDAGRAKKAGAKESR